MRKDSAVHADTGKQFFMTHHAVQRMDSRRISVEAVEHVLEYGRLVRTRGANIYVIGRKEIFAGQSRGIDLAALDGLQVVCGADGSIVTVYRNRDFRTLRPCHRRTH